MRSKPEGTGGGKNGGQMMGRGRGQVVGKMKIRLPEFQNLFDVVSREVDRWVEKNCTSCPKRNQCWTRWGVSFSSKVLECGIHTAPTKAFFELKQRQGLKLVEHPLSVERHQSGPGAKR